MKDINYDVVIFALSRHRGVDPFAIEASQRLEEDLGLDTFDVVLLSIALEDELDIEIPLARLEQVLTVGDLIAVVRSVNRARVWERRVDRVASTAGPRRVLRPI